MQRPATLHCIVSKCVVYASKKEDIPFGVSSFLLALRADANLLNATVRWTVARDGLTERNHNFHQRRKCKSSPVTGKKQVTTDDAICIFVGCFLKIIDII